MRQRLAQEAARIISEQGLRDFGLAKQKAAERLGISADVGLPSNKEVDQALRQHQSLFQSLEQPRWLRERRLAAVEAMTFFKDFEPRLVGAVLEGSADQYSAVCLHLFAQQPMEIAHWLEDRKIPFDVEERILRLDAQREMVVPVLKFTADDLAFDLTLLELDDLRQAPLDRVHGRSMRRAGIAAVRDLLDSMASSA